MANVGAILRWPRHGVGCFDPALILYRMREVFGEDLEYDANDLLDGHYQRKFETAQELGIGADSPVLKSAARFVREVSPRYRFRLRTGPDAFVTGQVDRYNFEVLAGDFPEPMLGRFMAFVRSLQLGDIHVIGDPV